MNKIKYKQVKLFFNLCSDNSFTEFVNQLIEFIYFIYRILLELSISTILLFFVIARTRTLRAFFHAQQVIQMFYFDYQPVTQAY